MGSNMNTYQIFRAGNSQVVTLPKSILSDVGIKVGQKVLVEKSSDNSAIVIRKPNGSVKANSKVKSEAEFEKWWKMFLEENGGILDDLA